MRHTYLTRFVRRQKKGVRITISITNPTTGIEFIMIVSQAAMMNDESLVRLYENHQYGMIELMVRKMIITKPARARPTPKRRADPGLSEIIGIITIVSIAVAAGGTFYYANT